MQSNRHWIRCIGVNTILTSLGVELNLVVANLVENDALRSLGIVSKNTVVIGIRTEADRLEIGHLRDEANLCASLLVIIMSGVLIGTSVINQHRYAKYITRQLSSCLYISQIHLIEVGHLAYNNIC